VTGEAGAQDKKALLEELKIDRTDSASSDGGRPLKWFVVIALVAGAGFALWFLDIPNGGSALPVKTAIARAASTTPVGSSVLDATGYVVARRQATVSSKATGKVMEVLIEEGVIVEEGQLLARLDDSIPRAQLELAESRLASARAALAELDVSLKQARLDLDRTQGLAERNLASQADLDRDGLTVEALIARLDRAKREIDVAERSLDVQRRMLEDMVIRAPFKGVVIAKAAQPGEMISPVSAGGGFTRTGICTIVDMESLEVEVDVNEAYINRVRANQPVQVTLNAYPDYQFPAKVIAIIPAADRNKATVRVRIGFLERDDRVLPDMGVRVAFLDEQADEQAVARPIEAPKGVLIPEKAIAQDDGGRYVYVVNDGAAVRRDVRVAGIENGRVRVTEGLANGERVVDQLSDEMLLALADGPSVTEVN
jgi:RND family efflux transporter MFP subunit